MTNPEGCVFMFLINFLGWSRWKITLSAEIEELVILVNNGNILPPSMEQINATQVEWTWWLWREVTLETEISVMNHLEMVVHQEVCSTYMSDIKKNTDSIGI